jgi:hypothetical protein
MNLNLIRSNQRARKIMLQMTLADLCKKYNLDLDYARRLKKHAKLLEAAK